MGAIDVQTRGQRRPLLAATALKDKARVLFSQFAILLRALVHPRVPWHAKLVCSCAVLYVASPIQLIPNFIPIIGQLDDVLVIGMSLRLLKRSVPQTVLDECEKKAHSPLTLSGQPSQSSSTLEPEASS